MIAEIHTCQHLRCVNLLVKIIQIYKVRSCLQRKLALKLASCNDKRHK